MRRLPLALVLLSLLPPVARAAAADAATFLRAINLNGPALAAQVPAPAANHFAVTLTTGSALAEAE